MLNRLRTLADATPWLAPLLAACWLPQMRGSVEVVGVLAVAPPLAATLLHRPGAIVALFVTALAWIASSLAFVSDWPSCWTSSVPSLSAPTAMAAAWWAPFALQAILLRGAERRTVLGDLVALCCAGAFGVAVIAMFGSRDALSDDFLSLTRGALTIAGAFAFFAWLMKSGFRYTRDPLASLWWPALPIAVVFTFVGLMSSTAAFHSEVRDAIQSWPALDRMLDPPLMCYGKSCWSMWYDVVALLLTLSGTATASAAVAIAVARARGSMWPSLVAFLALVELITLVLERYFADFGGSLPAPLQAFFDLGDFAAHHGALLTAGVTLPLAALAVRRARLGITPARSCVAVGALGLGAVVSSSAGSVFLVFVATAVSTPIAWLALEPPRALESVIGNVARTWRQRPS